MGTRSPDSVHTIFLSIVPIVAFARTCDNGPQKTSFKPLFSGEESLKKAMSGREGIILSILLRITRNFRPIVLFDENISVSTIYQVSWRIQNSCHDQDSLLVKRRNDNHSPGPVIRELVPSSH